MANLYPLSHLTGSIRTFFITLKTLFHTMSSENSFEWKVHRVCRPILLDSAPSQNTLARLEQLPKLWAHLSPQRTYVVHLCVEGSLWDPRQVTANFTRYPEAGLWRQVNQCSADRLHSALRTHVKQVRCGGVCSPQCCALATPALQEKRQANPWPARLAYLVSS